MKVGGLVDNGSIQNFIDPERQSDSLAITGLL